MGDEKTLILRDRGMLVPATPPEDTQRNRGRSGDTETAEDEQAGALQL